MGQDLAKMVEVSRLSERVVDSSPLPQYVAFKGHNGKFLGFCTGKEYRGSLKFVYDDLSSPYVKHEVVPDPDHDTFLHIKCCYNNKFWRPQQGGCIIADADSVGTDTSTVFQIPIVNADQVVLCSRSPVALFHCAKQEDICLSLVLGITDLCYMTYYDVGWMAILPKYVAFKGDNGNYLAAFWTESHEYLQFNTTDIGNGRVRHEVVPVGDGTVRLKCLHWNKFWRRSPNWIWADTADYNSSNKDLIFQPILVDQNSVALRCLGNNWFCKRLSTERKNDCLNAGTNSLERSAILRVEEPTLSRRVHSVKYDMDSAHIYDFVPLVLCKATAKNTSRQSTTLPLSFSYTEKKSSSWKNAVSFSTGIKATFNARIPVIANLKVEICGASTFVREWGETQETQTTITSSYHAPVDPGQTVEVILKGTHAKCDVKFSYVQEDRDTTGCVFKSSKEDGVFSGASYTDIQYETRYY